MICLKTGIRASLYLFPFFFSSHRSSFPVISVSPLTRRSITVAVIFSVLFCKTYPSIHPSVQGHRVNEASCSSSRGAWLSSFYEKLYLSPHYVLDDHNSLLQLEQCTLLKKPVPQFPRKAGDEPVCVTSTEMRNEG